MRIRVNPIDCAAHGLCAELLPEWVELDERRYSVIDGQPVPAALRGHARRAAAQMPRTCPRAGEDLIPATNPLH